jgi:hypothetical protein
MTSEKTAIVPYYNIEEFGENIQPLELYTLL